MMLGLDTDNPKANALWRRQQAHCWVQQALSATARLKWVRKEILQVQKEKKKNLIDSAFRFSSVHKTVTSKVLRHQVCRTKSGVGHSDFQHNTAHGPRVIFLVVQLKLMHVLPKAFNGILTTASVLTQKVMTNFH